MILFGRKRFSREYKEYLRSDVWQAKRAKALKQAGYKCQNCGRSGVVLHIHHKTYERLGRERAGDLQVLCENCHRWADRKRRVGSKIKRWLLKL